MWKVKLLARCYSMHTPWVPARSDQEARRAVAESAAARVQWRLTRGNVAEEEDGLQEQDKEDREALEEWAWACEEREDMCIEADGFGFLLMDLLRIVALESEPVAVSTREPADDGDQSDEGEGATDGSVEQLEMPTAWENTVSLALLADICRSQLQGYRRYTVPGNVASDVPKLSAESFDAGGLVETADASFAGSNTRVISARQAVEYERAVLLRKLGEIERALQDTTAVRLRSNSVATAEATQAIRQRRSFTRRRQALRPTMPE